ncbi:hypothetical protein EDB81DRAFT_252153 [Dactylonectria macrodidyma]|uniref:Secreted protein n=1 Tax=Dactylonectria macrodidyma TaxID=307937 RepID=A0A9P9FLJ2_9HYPO|nr:hypothetical protein EDB81DRAFT_252153 [Dactylonectria macrodidyma]
MAKFLLPFLSIPLARVIGTCGSCGARHERSVGGTKHHRGQVITLRVASLPHVPPPNLFVTERVIRQCRRLALQGGDSPSDLACNQVLAVRWCADVKSHGPHSHGSWFDDTWTGVDGGTDHMGRRQDNSQLHRLLMCQAVDAESSMHCRDNLAEVSSFCHFAT